ncbi:MAG TPA: cytochrome P450, partial [Microscillaceae bacterium]|nr:cytochrome P450 [Microscillaceae bacterium]
TTNGFSLPFWIPTPANQKLKKAINAYDTMMINIIESKIKQPGHTMLDLLIQAKDPESGEAMNPQQLIDEVRIFFAAGTETSANALTWAAYLLSQHSEQMAQLELEIKKVLGGNAPTLEILEQLPYLDQVVKESLRLYPPAWISSRTNEQADHFDGLEIPAGANIFYSAYMLQRNPSYWIHPDRFIPERFASENQENLPLQAFIPFGAGPRKCIGDRFALMEIKIILIRLLQNFQWELKAGFQPKPAFLGTLQAQEGMWIRFDRKRL